ncbi:hypothetical protein [Embleya scabrispora]|uniref:hypothetical protein n=1 Tax=Embleya scabrispora TaxID=159449 RepID=UPI00037FB7F4|nr:hypothetical protein [Embleya scabrispora]MYS84868.1 hypothetical protein [Streptomyces sp. SID5474]
MPTHSPDSTTKYAVRGFSESLRGEPPREGGEVGVTTACPGPGIKTAIVHDSRATRGTDRNKVAAVHDSLSEISPKNAALV